MTTNAAEVYVTALAVDTARARNMAKTWDRRLAGILEVSDRGEHATPRFAVVDGQHRWAAAQKLDPPDAGGQRA